MFKNNLYFANTQREMVSVADAHAERIAKYSYDYGEREVERFLDAVLSIEQQIDLSSIPRERIPIVQEKPKLRYGEFDDLFGINAPRGAEVRWVPSRRVPLEPVLDIIGFLAEHAELEPWQQDILTIVRSEMAYFAPQMRTKILNEGAATYAHTRIMRELDLSDGERIHWMQTHAGVVHPGRGQLNPYYLGYKLLESIEERWDKPSDEDKERFGMPGGQGKQKVFEVMRMENDLSLIRNYMTKQLVDDLDLFTYEYVEDIKSWVVSKKDWKAVRDDLVNQLSTYGIPAIYVVDGDFEHSRRLLLRHQHVGKDLDRKYADKTLEMIYRIWTHPVILETIYRKQPVRHMFNGTSHTITPIDKLLPVEGVSEAVATIVA